jgi:hypothetical protein
MSRGAKSLLVFGVYLLILGPTLAIAPNFVARVVGVPQTTEPWLRLVGVLVANIGIYYVVAARQDLAPVIAASVPVRFALPVWLLLFVLLAGADPAVMIFGGADIAGAVWTVLAIRAGRRDAR